MMSSKPVKKAKENN